MAGCEGGERQIGRLMIAGVTFTTSRHLNNEDIDRLIEDGQMGKYVQWIVNDLRHRMAEIGYGPGGLMVQMLRDGLRDGLRFELTGKR
jgi:hypothetical protein